MNPEAINASGSLRRIGAALLWGALLAAMAGCSATKDRYAATEDARQRQAFENEAETKAGSNIDTQATYLRLVDQMQQQGLWFASLAHIDALEQRWGVTPDSTRVRADALRQTGQTALAEAAYKRLLGTPQESAGYRGLGLLAGARGNYAEAVQQLRQAQRRTPTDALLLSDLGYAALRAGQFDEARLPLMQALQLRADSTQAQANLALYFEVTQQREQATALMETHRMPEASRQAVREAALQIRAQGGRPSAPTIATSVPGPAAVQRVEETQPAAKSNEAALEPLALKPSRWAGMAGSRLTANPLNPPAATSDAPSSNPPPRGTP
ncbi:tetratricopeptide repeat protein [Variovorax sp. Varisp41]|uniref:tetratricopeptide repeat protein n=1 Tax=unclassified Variovorax TaxID=663243 RepID=UPI0039B496B5